MAEAVINTKEALLAREMNKSVEAEALKEQTGVQLRSMCPLQNTQTPSQGTL